ncbi:MAG: aspartate--tRNA ligase, partial [Rikenellaceae bacterium]
NFLDSEGFLEIETPYLIKSTPEGARDFVVPSRMNPNEFYALPQSPQTFKQLLMVAGYDKYFQIVRCFRDEDLRADRQPEFTQIDCEMAFVEQEDVLSTFERWARYMFKEVMDVELGQIERMPWLEAMERYGSDKPDVRFGMEFADLTELTQGHGFSVFDSVDYVCGFAATGCASYTRKQIDALTEFVKRPQVGAKGLVWIKVDESGATKSSIDKFYTPDQVKAIADKAGAKAGDMVFILCGAKFKSLTQLCTLRLEVAESLGLRDNKVFKPLWVVDFPLFEWDEESGRYYAMHHPFTSPKPEDIHLLATDPGKVRANAYDFVCNGVEIGGGSIRIHDSKLQAQMFEILGFTPEKAEEQFGFLMNAFKFGAPPHGGLAFGFDRLCSLFGGVESIRDYIAFPKNNAGRDMMIDAPSLIDQAQLDELYLATLTPAQE